MRSLKTALKIGSVIFAIIYAGCEAEQGSFSIISIICLAWVAVFFLANFVKRKETASAKGTASNLFDDVKTREYRHMLAQMDLKDNFFT